MAGIRDRSGPRGTTSASDADLRDGLGVGGNSPTGVASQFHGVAPVPEPSTRAMGGIGLAMRGLGDARRRRQRALREQVALSTAGPGRRPSRAGVGDRHEGWHEWQDEAYEPDHGTRAALLR